LCARGVGPTFVDGSAAGQRLPVAQAQSRQTVACEMKQVQRAHSRLRVVTFAVLVSVSCQGKPSSVHEVAIDTTLDGTVVVNNYGDGIWVAGSGWTIVPRVRIGSRDGSAHSAFGYAGDIEVDDDGRIYVLDRQVEQIQVFAGDGSYVRTIGGKGRGPGEFSNVIGMVFDPSGRLWTFNQANQRYSVFDTSGTLLSEPPRRGGVRAAEWASVFSPAGDLFEIMFYGAVGEVVAALVRFDPIRKSVVDTMPMPGFPEGTPFGWRHYALIPNGWWLGAATDYRLWNITFAGDTLTVITRSKEPTEMSVAERDSATKQERDLRRRARGSFEMETELRPLFQGIAVDDRNFVWVILPPESDTAGTGFDVFDDHGRYLGEVTTSDRIDTMVSVVIRGTNMYYVTKDQLDVAYVVRADIEGRR
jgi:hypothetical protein